MKECVLLNHFLMGIWKYGKSEIQIRRKRIWYINFNLIWNVTMILSYFICFKKFTNHFTFSMLLWNKNVCFFKCKCMLCYAFSQSHYTCDSASCLSHTLFFFYQFLDIILIEKWEMCFEWSEYNCDVFKGWCWSSCDSILESHYLVWRSSSSDCWKFEWYDIFHHHMITSLRYFFMLDYIFIFGSLPHKCKVLLCWYSNLCCILLLGTLGYVMSEVEDGKPLSQVVRAAKSLGYTEPGYWQLLLKVYYSTGSIATQLVFVFLVIHL